MPERVVAVSGGSGFVGRRLVDAHLRRGDAVRVLTRREPSRRLDGVTYVIGDLACADEKVLNQFVGGADVVYHCAGELRDPERMRAVHVTGTQRLLTAAGDGGVRWIQLSSVGVYGPLRAGIVTEAARSAPVGVYERTKAEADDCVAGACASGNVDAVVIRPSIVIGADMPSPWLRSLCAAIERRVFAYIGRPGATINYVGVDDVARVMMLAGEIPRPTSRIYNVSRSATIEMLASSLASAMGMNPPSRRIPEWVARGAAGLARRVPRFPLTPQRVNALTNTTVYSAELAAAELGFVPRDSIETLCREVVASWRRTEATIL
jgi:nucleoside-diphosphate-sugar epimerase